MSKNIPHNSPTDMAKITKEFLSKRKIHLSEFEQFVKTYLEGKINKPIGINSCSLVSLAVNESVNKKTFSELLKFPDIDIFQKNSNGLNAIDRAISKQKFNLLKLLREFKDIGEYKIKTTAKENELTINKFLANKNLKKAEKLINKNLNKPSNDKPEDNLKFLKFVQKFLKINSLTFEQIKEFVDNHLGGNINQPFGNNYSTLLIEAIKLEINVDTLSNILKFPNIKIYQCNSKNVNAIDFASKKLSPAVFQAFYLVDDISDYVLKGSKINAGYKIKDLFNIDKLDSKVILTQKPLAYYKLTNKNNKEDEIVEIPSATFNKVVIADNTLPTQNTLDVKLVKEFFDNKDITLDELHGFVNEHLNGNINQPFGLQKTTLLIEAIKARVNLKIFVNFMTFEGIEILQTDGKNFNAIDYASTYARGTKVIFRILNSITDISEYIIKTPNKALGMKVKDFVNLYSDTKRDTKFYKFKPTNVESLNNNSNNDTNNDDNDDNALNSFSITDIAKYVLKIKGLNSYALRNKIQEFVNKYLEGDINKPFGTINNTLITLGIAESINLKTLDALLSFKNIDIFKTNINGLNAVDMATTRVKPHYLKKMNSYKSLDGYVIHSKGIKNGNKVKDLLDSVKNIEPNKNNMGSPAESLNSEDSLDIDNNSSTNNSVQIESFNTVAQKKAKMEDYVEINNAPNNAPNNELDALYILAKLAEETIAQESIAQEREALGIGEESAEL